MTSGEELRDEGKEAAVAHANSAAPDWSEQASGMFALYAQAHQGRVFMTEDVRIWAEQQGLPRPPDARAWGHIATMALRDGVVAKAGMANCKRASGHAGPRSTWIRA